MNISAKCLKSLHFEVQISWDNLFIENIKHFLEFFVNSPPPQNKKIFIFPPAPGNQHMGGSEKGGGDNREEKWILWPHISHLNILRLATYCRILYFKQVNPFCIYFALIIQISFSLGDLFTKRFRPKEEVNYRQVGYSSDIFR